MKKTKPIWKSFQKKQKENKNVEKIEQKKKDIILKVKIDNFDLDIQMDTGSEVALIPKKLWIANFTKEEFTTPPIW